VEKTKTGYLEVRLDDEEKQAFKDAADLAGLALSTWVRERLRTVARKELDEVGKPVAFMK
jgi:antitoxin component of RelBE/YafQ-DinJ toxin-antitoxin module